MKEVVVLFSALMLIFMGTVTYADIYKWVDDNGVIVFGDTPPDKGEAKVVNLPEEPAGGSGFSAPAEVKPTSFGNSAGRQTAGSPKVELYSTSWCPYCKKAAEFFRSRGIPFTEYDIEKDQSAALRKQQLDSRSGVPFAVVNGQKIHGYSEAAYQQALAQ